MNILKRILTPRSRQLCLSQNNGQGDGSCDHQLQEFVLSEKFAGEPEGSPGLVFRSRLI